MKDKTVKFGNIAHHNKRWWLRGNIQFLLKKSIVASPQAQMLKQWQLVNGVLSFSL